MYRTETVIILKTPTEYTNNRKLRLMVVKWARTRKKDEKNGPWKCNLKYDSCFEHSKRTEKASYEDIEQHAAANQQLVKRPDGLTFNQRTDAHVKIHC